jgi:hypothetical protein
LEEAELPEPALSFGPLAPRHHQFVVDTSGGVTFMPFGSDHSSPKDELGSARTIFTPFGRERDKILNADQKGNVLVYDTCENNVCAMPRLKGCMANSIPMNMGDALYIIKRCPEKPYSPYQACFQALIHGKPPEDVHEAPGWHWHALPPPPYVEAPYYKPSRNSEISALVVFDKSILISATGIGTYYFNTTNRAWSKMGSWELPFHGAAEYAPELGSWMAFSPKRKEQFLCVWDLTAFAYRAPRRCHIWCAREDLAIPKDWELLGSHIVRVDYGKFCIARSFHVYEDLDGSRSVKEKFMVLTGMEVGECSEADGRIRMVKHRSIRYNFDGYTAYWVF